MNEFVLGALDKGKLELELSSGRNSTPLQAEEIKFDTDPTVEGHVKTAIDNFSKIISEHELIVRFVVPVSSFRHSSISLAPDRKFQRMR
jgi:hypothetical protein